MLWETPYPLHPWCSKHVRNNEESQDLFQKGKAWRLGEGPANLKPREQGFLLSFSHSSNSSACHVRALGWTPGHSGNQAAEALSWEVHILARLPGDTLATRTFTGGTGENWVNRQCSQM